MTPNVRAAMQAMLRRNTILQRDMARSPRRGILFVAEIIMEARVVADFLDGTPPNIKRLESEVVPALIGERTAHKILREMIAEGLLATEADPKDGRATLMMPTAKLIDRAHRRWERLAAAT
jgi:Winged helix DNA-binding domain